MNPVLSRLTATVTFVLIAALPGCAKNEAATATHLDADLILHNGKVITVDKQFSIHSAIAVSDGKIIAVGGNELVQQYAAPENVDLNGRVLMPGYTDTHVHVRTLSPRDVDLVGNFSSIGDVRRLVSEKAKQLGPGEWITGYGWDEALFSEKRNLLRSDLDEAAPENPVVLTRAGGHSSVGNSLALRIAGIDRNTPEPDEGVIEHDENGEPNGIIRERSDLYRMHVPKNKWAELKDSYVDSLKDLLALGITSVFDAGSTLDDQPVDAGGIEEASQRQSYRRLRPIYDDQGVDLPRLTLYVNYPGAERLEAFPHATGYGDERLRLGPIGENAIDGGFTGPAAWTLVDYIGMPGYRGKGRYSDEELQDLVDTSAMLGWQLGLHAIGDAAIVQQVNSYATAIRNGYARKGKDHRWFLDHFTIMPPDETMQTMAEYNMLIAQQPNFLWNLEGRYAALLDEWRLKHNNPIGTPHNKFGLFVAFGSDNLPIDPRVGLYVAVTRKGMSGTAYGYEEEAVSIQEAIRMYTANGPYLSWEEDVKGTLEPGKYADMIVLDRDPLTIPPEELLRINVDLTYVGGRLVYERE